MRGNKDFSTPACSDTARSKISNEPAAACDLGLNFNFQRPQSRASAAKFSASQ
nr:hypothetical protein [uncultured Campylobacter sp.]